MAIEMVDLPNLKIVIFHNYVCLPEGIKVASVLHPRW